MLYTVASADASRGRLVTSFVQANLVDELTVGIVPVLLGEGRHCSTRDPDVSIYGSSTTQSSAARHGLATDDADDKSWRNHSLIGEGWFAGAHRGLRGGGTVPAKDTAPHRRPRPVCVIMVRRFL